MAQLINLRRARKARDRAGQEAQAATNRAAHGRTRAEREETAAREALEARRIEGHRVARDEPDA